MWPRPGTILNITATASLALPSAVCVAPRTQSQRSQRSASFGRRCPQNGHGILSPVVGSGRAAGASVYSTFIFTESHKPQGIRQANRSEQTDHERHGSSRFSEPLCRTPALASTSVTFALSVVGCAVFYFFSDSPRKLSARDSDLIRTSLSATRPRLRATACA